jgi:hypothetical protein
MLAGAFHFILIALVTLPIAGVPFAIWLWIDLRRFNRAHHVKPHLVVSS